MLEVESILQSLSCRIINGNNLAQKETAETSLTPLTHTKKMLPMIIFDVPGDLVKQLKSMLSRIHDCRRESHTLTEGGKEDREESEEAKSENKVVRSLVETLNGSYVNSTNLSQVDQHVSELMQEIEILSSTLSHENKKHTSKILHICRKICFDCSPSMVQDIYPVNIQEDLHGR
jgi:hypothetical protein